MPKIDIAKAAGAMTVRRIPTRSARRTDGREQSVLGNVAGLTQFGVNLTDRIARISRSHSASRCRAASVSGSAMRSA